MKKINYFKIINKYINPNSLTYSLYVPHVSLVTGKAIKIALKMELKQHQLQFIEEAGMLHDIGIIGTNSANHGCTGLLPYICHGVEGRKILEAEELPKHALVAERHNGVGIMKDEIVEQNLPLPHRDLFPQTLEEKIIAWADLFYSKTTDSLFVEKTLDEIRPRVIRFGKRNEKTFNEWQNFFSKYS